MKSIFAPIALALAPVGLIASPVSAQDQAQVTEPAPASLALAKQIIDLGMPEDMREDMFFGAMDQMTIQVREASIKAFGLTDEGAIAVLDEWTADYMADSKDILRGHIPMLMDGMAKSYAVMFTQQELEDILAFVSTPSGQKFFELSSAVLAEPNFAEANQNYMNEAQALLPAAQQDLIARLRTYQAEQAVADAGASS